MKKIIFTDEQVKLIKKLYEENKPLKEIAELLKFGDKNFIRSISNLDLPSREDIRINRKELNSNEILQIKDLFINNESFDKITKKFNININYLKEILKSLELKTKFEINNELLNNKDIVDQIKKLHALNYSAQKIADKLNISVHNIRTICDELNLFFSFKK
jgi:predicted DNA-binding protein YlxM (UPF0122 family)